MIYYTSFNDLSNTIRRNAWKIPADIDLIVGVPRSGLMCAIMISEIINKPVISLENFLAGEIPLNFNCNRAYFDKEKPIKKVLVLEDTVYSGRSILEAKNKVLNMENAHDYEFIIACVYAEGAGAKDKVDLYLEENYRPDTELVHLYEWNIFHHDNYISLYCMYDMDGILCKEPPDERNTEEYVKYIKDAIPMIVPSSTLGAIVTYRLNKYREETEQWLQKAGVKYNHLYMIASDSYEERSNSCSPAQYKAYVYGKSNWARVFIESDINQAKEIAQLTHKPVICYENGKIYR